jgi:hypothetical protein
LQPFDIAKFDQRKVSNFGGHYRTTKNPLSLYGAGFLDFIGLCEL